MTKGKGLGQLQHSFNNLSLETATMPPNVKDILNRRGDAIVNSIRIGRTPVQSAIQGILKTLSTVPYPPPNGYINFIYKSAHRRI